MMKRKIVRAVLPGAALLALFLPLSNAAAPSQKVLPGLWEIKVSVETVDSEPARRKYEKLRKQLESVPPEQRKKFEAAIPRPGVPMVQTERICLTPEQASKGPGFSGVDEDEDCRTEYGEPKGGRIPVKMTCKEQSATGVGEVAVAGGKGWSSNMRMITREPGEPPSETVMRTESRWLSSDCGSVKPEKD
jgi:hypothetical protein